MNLQMCRWVKFSIYIFIEHTTYFGPFWKNYFSHESLKKKKKKEKKEKILWTKICLIPFLKYVDWRNNNNRPIIITLLKEWLITWYIYRSMYTCKLICHSIYQLLPLSQNVLTFVILFTIWDNIFYYVCCTIRTINLELSLLSVQISENHLEKFF